MKRFLTLVLSAAMLLNICGSSPVFAEEEEALEIILPEEEDLSLPVGEIILPDPDEMIEFEPADEPAEKPAGKDDPAAAKDVPELIIEEPTLF